MNYVIGIDPEQPVASGVIERELPGGSEIVPPWVIEYAGRILCGDVLGPVVRTGVHDNDFVNVVPYAVQATAKCLLFIFYDQTGGYAHQLSFR
jgi:hypothetical protein